MVPHHPLHKQQSEPGGCSLWEVGGQQPSDEVWGTDDAPESLMLLYFTITKKREKATDKKSNDHQSLHNLNNSYQPARAKYSLKLQFKACPKFHPSLLSM